MSQIYVSVKTQYWWFEKQTDAMQEQVLLMDWLNNQIQTAGFADCDSGRDRPWGSGIMVLNKRDLSLLFHVRHKAWGESNVIKLLHTSEPFNAIKKNWQGSKMVLLTRSATDLDVGDNVLVSDCQNLMMNVITRNLVSQKRLIVKSPLTAVFQYQGVVAKYGITYLYIRKVKQQTALYTSNSLGFHEISNGIDGIALIKQKNTRHYQVKLSGEFNHELQLGLI